MVHVPLDWEDAGRLSPSGGTAADRADATSERGQDLDISSPERINDRGNNAGAEHLNIPLSEHFHTIHLYKAKCVPVSEFGAVSMGTGLEAVSESGDN